jgi:macrolide-specific efflux system membrane fusion protein
VSEADVSKLRQGMEVYFTTLGSQGRRWYGALRKVEPTPTITNNVVLYNALFDVPNANQSLMTSMTAQVFFVAASAKNALLIPAVALNSGTRSGDAAGRRDRGASGPGREDRTASAPPSEPAASAASPGASGSTSGFATRTSRAPRRASVKVLTATGTLDERPVELGVSNRVQAQVLSGLTEGDQVVTGVKLPPAAPHSSAPSQPGGGGLQQNPAGLPPGMGGGQRGR